MKGPVSKVTQSLKHLGEIQVNDWEFTELLNKNLDLGASLRKLGNLKVIDWDFESAMPRVHQFAHQEVEIPEIIRRAANFKVLDLDLNKSSHAKPDKPDAALVRKTRNQLKAFLQFTLIQLIDEPEKAEIRVEQIADGVLRFRVLLTPKDTSEAIGRNGATASAIRNILKTKASSHGLQALLEIRSHEDVLTPNRNGKTR